ncbi:hypothetical protein TeGR_g680, partial [Tetraparma gracilis]
TSPTSLQAHPFLSSTPHVLSCSLLFCALGVRWEETTSWGRSASAPIVTMFLALLASNLSLVPFSSPVYSFATSHLVPLSVPLLLFNGSLRSLLTSGRALLPAFLLGSLSTALGTVLAFSLLPLRSLGADAPSVAAALCARHVGGAVNFVAVAGTFGVKPDVVAAAIAADNVVVGLYFVLLFALAGKPRVAALPPPAPSAAPPTPPPITLSSLAVSLSLSSLLASLGSLLTSLLLPPRTSPLPLTSVLTVAAASLRPQLFSRNAPAASALGVLFMQFFFAASGAAGSISLVLSTAPSLFLFSLLQISLHLLLLLPLGRLLGLPLPSLLLASNACVGGSTTAAGMAKAKGWDELVLPAVLVGVAGYAGGTLVGIGVGAGVLRRMAGV